MSNILEFRQAAARRPASQHSESLGEILLFTGIRYVRDEEPPEETVLRDLLPPVLDGSVDASERLKA